MRSALKRATYIWELLKQQHPITDNYCQRNGQHYDCGARQVARKYYKRETRAGLMGEDSAKTAHSEAQQMLDAFASVGATRFDVTWTTRSGEKEWFRRRLQLAELARTLPAMLDNAATASERNVIVRPHGPGITFLQLDDLKADRLPALPPPCFSPSKPRPEIFRHGLRLKGARTRILRGGCAEAPAPMRPRAAQRASPEA